MSSSSVQGHNGSPTRSPAALSRIIHAFLRSANEPPDGKVVLCFWRTETSPFEPRTVMPTGVGLREARRSRVWAKETR